MSDYEAAPYTIDTLPLEFVLNFTNYDELHIFISVWEKYIDGTSQ